MKILEVGLGLYPQPDGCVGYKVGIKTDEPSTRWAHYYPRSGSREVVSEEPVDHTWYLFGAIVPPESEGVTLEELVEGTAPVAPEGHDPFHGVRDPISQEPPA